MSFLQKLVKSAAHKASQVYDQANVFDNGLSYQTRQVNPNVPQRSVVQQAANVGYNTVKPVVQVPVQFAENYANTFANLGNRLGGGHNMTIQQNMGGSQALNKTLKFSNATGQGKQLAGDVAQIGLSTLPGVGQGAKLAFKVAGGSALGAGFNAAATAGDGGTKKDIIKSAVIGGALGGAIPALPAVARGSATLSKKGVKTAAGAVNEARGKTFNGLPKEKIITDINHLKALDSFQEGVYDQKPLTSHHQQEVINQLHDIKNKHGLDFISGSPKDRADRIADYRQQWDTSLQKYQKALEKPKSPILKPLNEDGFIGNKPDEYFYHGTPGKLDGLPRPSSHGELGPGFYVSKDKNVAHGYTKDWDRGYTGKTHRFSTHGNYKDIERAEFLEKRSELYDKEQALNGGKWDVDVAKRAEQKLIDHYKKQGYDGLYDVADKQGVVFPESINRLIKDELRPSRAGNLNPNSIIAKGAQAAKGMLSPLDEVGGGAVENSPIRKALQGEKKPLPQDPDTALSKFPNRLLEEDRTAPIHQPLVNLSTHEVKHNAPVLQQTAAKIAKNEDQALSFAKRGSSTEANATALQLLDKYLAEGSSEKAIDLVQAVSPRFTRQGQETQILAAYSKLTPAGAVRYAAKQIEKATPKAQRLEDEAAQAHAELQNTAKEVAGQLETEIKQGTISVKRPRPTKTQARNAIEGTTKEPKTPQEMLAARIKSSADRTKASEPDPIKDMVNTLHKVAKEVLPESAKNAPRDPMELIGQAIKGKTEYRDIYDKAKALVMEKYQDNPAALEELDKYFTNNPEKTYAQGQLNRGVQQELKGTDLGKLVKEHYSKVDETGQELRDKLIERAGLSKAEATQLSADIQKRYGELVQQRKDSILKQMFGEHPTPEQKTAADRVLTLHNLGAMNKDELRPLVAQKLGIETLSNESVAKISGMADAIQRLPKDSPERLRATAEMMKYIADQVPQSAGNKALSVWKAGLLSGVKTQTGNALSNGTFGALHAISNVPATLIDKSLSLKTGQRTKALTSAGFASGAKQGAKSGLNTMKTGIDMRNITGDKYEVHGEVSFKNKLANNLVAKPTNFVFRGMSAADQPFYFAALKNNMIDMAKADGINKGLRGAQLDSHVQQLLANPTPEITEAATLAAQKSVLSQDNALASSLSRFTREHPYVQPLVPFVKVPTNFLVRTLDFTPAGAIKEAVKQVKAGKFDQRAFSEAVGEATTGTALIYLGAELANSNLVSGQYPQNDPKEAQRWKTEKIQPNSVKIGGTWIGLNYLGPVGMLFGAGKDYVDAAKRGDNGTVQAITGMGKNLTGQSFLTGFSGFANAIQDPQRSAKSFINSETGSLIPSISNDAANLFDNKQRQANSPLDQARSRIPGVRNNLPAKIDVYGNELTQRTNKLNLLANPLKPSDSRTNDVISEVARLHYVDPNNTDLQVTPMAVKKTVKVGNNEIKLSDKQVYDLQKQVGQTTQTKWGELIKKPEYQRLSDLDKANALNKVRQGATELAQREYVTKNNLGEYSKGASKAAQNVSNSDFTKFAKGKGSSTSPSTKPDFSAAPDTEYKYLKSQYDDSVKNKKFTSDAAKIKAETALTRAKVGADYPYQVRTLYGLSKAQLSQYVNNNPDGQKLAEQVVAYGDALKDAGVNSYNKFRSSTTGAVSIAPAAKKASSGRKSTGIKKTSAKTAKYSLPKMNNSGAIAMTKSVSGKVRSSTVKSTSSNKKVTFNSKIKQSKTYKLAKISKGRTV